MWVHKIKVELVQTLRLPCTSSVMRLAWCAKHWQLSSVHIMSSRTKNHTTLTGLTLGEEGRKELLRMHVQWKERARVTSRQCLRSTIDMTQPLPGKPRCSTGPCANAIISRAKYTCRFMLLMAKLIGQIECCNFQQQTDDLPRTLITADRHWNVFWGEQTFGLSSVFRPTLSFWDSVTLYKQSALAVVKGKEKCCC